MMERRRLAIGLKGMKNAKATKTKTKTFASLRRLKRRCFSRFSIPSEEPVSAPTSLPPGARQHVSVRGVVWGAPARAPESVAREPGLERRDRGKSRVATSESGGGGVPEMSPLRFGGCVRA
jgi:hypothetical protein